MSLRTRMIEVLREQGPLSLGDLSDHLSWEIDVTYDQVATAMEAHDVYVEVDGSVWLATEDAA